MVLEEDGGRCHVFYQPSFEADDVIVRVYYICWLVPAVGWFWQVGSFRPGQLFTFCLLVWMTLRVFPSRTSSVRFLTRMVFGSNSWSWGLVFLKQLFSFSTSFDISGLMYTADFRIKLLLMAFSVLRSFQAPFSGLNFCVELIFELWKSSILSPVVHFPTQLKNWGFPLSLSFCRSFWTWVMRSLDLHYSASAFFCA